MEKDFYSILVKCSNVDYDRKQASKLILLIKHCKNENKIQTLKLELFKKSSKLLIKAINNFFKLTENFPKEKVIHENIDIAVECWFIFDRCVQNIKIEDHKKYSFYINTSLNRGIYRLFEKHYKKHYDVVSSSDANEISISFAKVNPSVDLTDIDLINNFTELEIEIINFKVSGDKLRDFLKKFNINNSDYNIHLDNIKIKMLRIYRDVKQQDEEDDY